MMFVKLGNRSKVIWIVMQLEHNHICENQPRTQLQHKQRESKPKYEIAHGILRSLPQSDLGHIQLGNKKHTNYTAKKYSSAIHAYCE
jgi:hypothetical protein